MSTLGVAFSSIVPGLWAWTVRTVNVKSNFKYMLRKGMKNSHWVLEFSVFLRNLDKMLLCSTNTHPTSLT